MTQFDTLSLSDLKRIFFGGETDEELAFYRAAANAGISAVDLLALVRVDGNTSPAVVSSTTFVITQLTQAAYNALTPDANTLYIIVG